MSVPPLPDLDALSLDELKKLVDLQYDGLRGYAARAGLDIVGN